jgi:hypothetical protein
MALMGQREYARHRNCALRAVQKAIESGRIKTVQHGARQMIDAEQADLDWQLNTDPAKQSLLHGTGPAPTSAGADETEADDGLGDDEPAPPAGEMSSAYREARGEREQLRLKKEQFEFDQQRGQLIDIDEARRLAFTAFRTLRDSVLHVPARVKDQCAATTDALLIEQLLEAELSDALSKLDPDRMLAELVDEDDDAD